MPDGIVATHLAKTFRVRDRLFGSRTDRTAVADLTLSVPPGRITGLLGLNGAGKTTTIKIFATLLRPTSGSVTVDGQDIVTQARLIRRRINLIAGGERMVYARMTGRENLRYFGLLYGVPGDVLRRRIDELLDLVGLVGAADTVVERYSRGMTQRLSIARGLINDPRYLLLDEPTLGLDAPIARDLRQVVRRLAEEGKGVLLTSHYLKEVEELCGHVYVIAAGRHVTEGTPAELTAATGGRRMVQVTVPDATEAVLSAVSALALRSDAVADNTARPDGTTSITLTHRDDLVGPLVSAIVSAGGSVCELKVTEPSLEDAVLALADRPSRPAVTVG